MTPYAQKAQECENGDSQNMEECAKELRGYIFPPSTRMEFESNNSNHMMSTIFFFANRFAKSMTVVSKFEKS